jgi:hypothetical protein
VTGQDDITADELIARLAADPEHQARKHARDAERRERGLAMVRELEPVLARIREAGVDVTSVNALRGTPRARFRKALPPIVAALDDASPDVLRVLGGLLAREDASPEATVPLMRTYLRRRVDDDAQWSLANALAEVADDRIAPDLAGAVADPERGKSREMLVVAAGRLDPERGTPIALAALEDRALDGHAMIALRALDAREAVPRIRARLDALDEDWKREEAVRTLDALGG